AASALYIPSLHDALPISSPDDEPQGGAKGNDAPPRVTVDFDGIRERIVNLPTEPATLRNLQVGKSGELYYLASPAVPAIQALNRSEEHTSELQSRENLVC